MKEIETELNIDFPELEDETMEKESAELDEGQKGFVTGSAIAGGAAGVGLGFVAIDVARI